MYLRLYNLKGISRCPSTSWIVQFNIKKWTKTPSLPHTTKLILTTKQHNQLSSLKNEKEDITF